MAIKFSWLMRARMNLAGWRAEAKQCSDINERRFALRQALVWRAEIRRELARLAVDRTSERVWRSKMLGD